MNTTITKDQMILHEGELYLLHPTKFATVKGLIPEKTPCVYKILDKTFFRVERKAFLITHSTSKLDGVIHLQKEWFVKGEDVEEMAQKFIENTSDFDGADDGWIRLFKNIFKAGHNANKGEFSREEMIQAMTMTGAYADSNPKATHKDVMTYIGNYINSLRSLQLPEKIVLSPDGELVEIQW